MMFSVSLTPVMCAKVELLIVHEIPLAAVMLTEFPVERFAVAVKPRVSPTVWLPGFGVTAIEVIVTLPGYIALDDPPVVALPPPVTLCAKAATQRIMAANTAFIDIAELR